MRLAHVSRRQFLSGLVSAAALLVGLDFGASAAPTPFRPHAFVSIEVDGQVTIVAHRSEMGQGIRTMLPLVLADEMEADWSRVRLVQADANEARYGSQATDGSRSMREFFLPMREAGAAIRRLLEMAAARQWGVPFAAVEARNHHVVHKADGRSLGYGSLVAVARTLRIPSRRQVVLKDPSAFRYIGKEVPIQDLPAMVVGQAQYGIDIVLEGMKHAVVARPPVYGGRAVAVYAVDTLKVPGVERIVSLPAPTLPAAFHPLGGVAVVARHTWAAIQGRDKLRITWDDGPNGSYDSTLYQARLEETVRRPGKLMRNHGNVVEAMRGADRILQADYYVPLLAHAPMEPPVATADVRGGRCEIWACTQDPAVAQQEVAAALGLPRDHVTVHVTLLGGGFGRKSKPDFVVEAALLSRAVGAPVKLTWTREDEIQHDYYHTVSAQHLEAGLDADGRPVAWLHRVAYPSINATFEPGVLYPTAAEVSMGVTDVPFDIPNLRCEAGPAEPHVRIGWFRSVDNLHQAFAVQCFVAELASLAGRDPKDYLLDVIGPPRMVDLSTSMQHPMNYGVDFKQYPIDTARLRHVIEVAAGQAGWGRPMAPGRGLGLAAHRSFLTYVCTVVEVEVQANGRIVVPRVDVAVDCGQSVSPDRIRSQMEGATVMGLSIALYGEITARHGRIEQSNFNDFEIVRMNQAPLQTFVHLVDSQELPGGVGEPGLPPFAPALCNAIFAATGRRIRRLPIKL